MFLEVASLKMSHFSEAIAAIQPSTSEVTTRKFEEGTSNFGDFLSLRVRVASGKEKLKCSLGSSGA